MNLIEIKKTKNSKEENFPVGSRLISKKFRSQILIFYDFARAADDIADSPNLTSKEKIKRLNLFKKNLEKEKPNLTKIIKLKQVCQKNKISLNHAFNLLKAFKQDALKNRYKNWAELIGYCKYSAVPVVRFVVDLHGEKKEAYKFSDPLCIALQILNHIQDIKKDYKEINRIYLPHTFIKKYKINLHQIKKNYLDKNMRDALNEILFHTEKLIIKANKYKRIMKNNKLSKETNLILEIAKKLLILLKKNDPLKNKVVLNKFDYLKCFVKSFL